MRKNVCLMVALTVFLVAASINSDAQDPGPDSILLKNGSTPLPFTHRKHQNLQSSECFHCHAANKWKIDDWGKEVAHAMCISCHDLNEKGPITCKDCHK